MCFVVLWIPTVNHVPIPFDSPLHGGERKFNISDDPSEPFFVIVKTKGKDLDILIQKEHTTSEFEHFLTLHYLDFSHNGMVKYSFDAKFLENSEFGFDDKTFPEAIYHLIKSFYHVHEFHEDESDSSFKPFVSAEDIDIHKRDNLALRHYLKNYERAVLDLVNSAKRLLRYVTDLEKKGQGQESIREYDSFPDMYVMALGYDTYIRSLFESVYNKECRITNEDKELRRRAFNLENSVRYFKALYVYFDTRIRQKNYFSILKKAEDNLKNSEESLRRLETNLEATQASLNLSQQSLDTAGESLDTSKSNLSETISAAKSSTKFAVISIVISALFSITGILYSIKTSDDSTRQLEKVKSELIETLNEVKQGKSVDESKLTPALPE
ncbi:MAG: hypothetical protein K2K58_11020 [Muribaculaceae bacterium]|nr:hypothetical protein [Muribaculaceae bacterium]